MVRDTSSPTSRIAKYAIRGFLVGLIILAILHVYFKTESPGAPTRLFWDFVVLGVILFLTLPWSIFSPLMLNGASAGHVWPWILLANCTLLGLLLGAVVTVLSRRPYE